MNLLCEFDISLLLLQFVFHKKPQKSWKMQAQIFLEIILLFHLEIFFLLNQNYIRHILSPKTLSSFAIFHIQNL